MRGQLVPSVVQLDEPAGDRLEAVDRVKQQRVSQQQLECGLVHGEASLFSRHRREASRRRSNVTTTILRADDNRSGWASGHPLVYGPSISAP
jgi:hypothetical protein